MDAQTGDRLVVQSRRVGTAAQTGEIMEVLGSGAGQHYRVRWSDGREAVVYPGSDAVIERATGTAAPAAAAPATETHTVTIRLDLEEDTDQCRAVATLRTSSGTFTGEGRARRNPADPVVPMIGEELAVARSLASLSARLEQAAAKAIATRESRPLHLV